MNPGSRYTRLAKEPINPRLNNGTIAGGLAHALQSGLKGYAQYKLGEEEKAKKAETETRLANALNSFLPASPEVQAMAADPLAGGGAPVRAGHDTTMLAQTLLDPATAGVGQAMIAQMMKEPEKPRYVEVGGDLVRIGPNGDIGTAYQGRGKPGQGFSLSPGQTRYDAQGNEIASAGPKGEDRYVTVPGVGLYDRQTSSYVGQGPSRPPSDALPGPSGDPAANLSPKAAQDVRVNDIKAGTAQLAKEEIALEESRVLLADLNRFEELMKVQDTGGWLRKIPGAGAIEGAFDPEIAEMRALSNKITPKMRQGMPGAASDRDVGMFRGATVAAERDGQVNRNIIIGYRASIGIATDRLAFRQAYLNQNGSLSGADEAWRGYVEANPIFDPRSTVSAPELNKNRTPWREYFSGAPSEAPKPEKDGWSIQRVD